MAEVILKNISKNFGQNCVLSELNLKILSGEFVTLLGPSGCGKTTLLRMVAGLESVDKGDLLIDNQRYNDVSPQNRPISMVFQSYALFPHMSVKKNILFGLKIQKTPHYKCFEKLNWVLPLLNLNGLEDRLPKEISGGQRQRVALARALVLDPSVLLLDEPLSNLDAALRDMAMEEIRRIHQQVGKTVIYVTHNQAEAMLMSDRIAIVNNGKIEQYDCPKIIYESPDTVFCAKFIGNPAINMYEGVIVAEDGKNGVKNEIGFIKVSGKIENKLNGKKVVFGIRPQSIQLSTQSIRHRRSSDSPVTVATELVETMGDRNLIVGRLKDGSIVRFLVSHDEDVSKNENVNCFIDGRRIHVFDPQTGNNLLSG